MILLNFNGVRWRWLLWKEHLQGYYLDLRWLGFQICFYTPKAADMIVGVLSNPMNFPGRSDRNND